MRGFYLREYLRSSLWFIPAMCVVLAAGLALVLIAVDQRLGPDAPGFSGGPESARTFLSTISSSMITFTGLVFTITIVVLQLASQQFSPRVLRTFLRDRHSQLSLGVFVATFAYALIVLREVPSAEAAEGQPRLAVSGAFVLVVLSIVVFVDYIHHIAQSIRVASITRSIGEETRAAIADIYDHPVPGSLLPLPAGEPDYVVTAQGRGIVRPWIATAWSIWRRATTACWRLSLPSVTSSRRERPW